jgi:hypothetical protein
VGPWPHELVGMIFAFFAQYIVLVTPPPLSRP